MALRLSDREPNITNFDGVSQDARAQAEALTSAIKRADAALDVEAFIALLAPDVVLRIGAQPKQAGHASVRAAIAGLFGAMRSGVRHDIARVWGNRQAIVYQADVTFPLKDARDVTQPYVNVLDIGADGLVSRYAIVIDPSPMRGS